MTEGREESSDYRRGYVEGAIVIMKTIGDNLPEQQRRVIDRWIADVRPLFKVCGHDHPPPRQQWANCLTCRVER